MKNRFNTRGIAETMPMQLQLMMWNLYNEVTGKKDYLQIFRIVPEGLFVKIEHWQEEPAYSRTVYIRNNESFSELEESKVYIVDDENHQIMMYTDEY